jgi:hypothetical protein
VRRDIDQNRATFMTNSEPNDSSKGFATEHNPCPIFERDVLPDLDVRAALYWVAV